MQLPKPLDVAEIDFNMIIEQLQDEIMNREAELQNQERAHKF